MIVKTIVCACVRFCDYGMSLELEPSQNSLQVAELLT